MSENRKIGCCGKNNGRVIRLTSNPWFPGKESECVIVRGGVEEVVHVIAEKPLFTYQVDVLNEHILRGDTKPNKDAVTWEHSLGNATIINEWHTS